LCLSSQSFPLGHVVLSEIDPAPELTTDELLGLSANLQQKPPFCCVPQIFVNCFSPMNEYIINGSTSLTEVLVGNEEAIPAALLAQIIADTIKFPAPKSFNIAE
jgi:hypothetical protein